MFHQHYCIIYIKYEQYKQFQSNRFKNYNHIFVKCFISPWWRLDFWPGCFFQEIQCFQQDELTHRNGCYSETKIPAYFSWPLVEVLGGGACVRVQAVFSGRRTSFGAVDFTVVQRLCVLAVGLARVVAEDAGVDTGQRAHAAAITWVESRCTQFQLIITRYMDERTPPESLFEACSEPAIPQGIICTLCRAFKCPKKNWCVD